MCRTILVPLDGSEFSTHALPLAAAIARRSGGQVRLARVHGPVLDERGLDAPADFRARREERDALGSVVRQFTDAGVPADSELLDGFVVDALGGHALAVGADLVVMTTHGRGPLSRFWLGSVADQPR